MYNVILPTITGRLLRKRFHINQARGRFALFYRGYFMRSFDNYHEMRAYARRVHLI